MHTPTQIIDEIIRREGGFNDIREDKGGATNYGVSLRYARGIGLDNDADGDTDTDDIRLVTADQARELYLSDFYSGPGIARLPAALHPVMTDWAVNSGPPRPIMALQKILNAAGFPCGQPDGVIGRRTVSQAVAADQAMGPLLVNAICEARESFYRGLAANDPSQRKFLRGWVNRAREFRVGG